MPEPMWDALDASPPPSTSPGAEPPLAASGFAELALPAGLLAALAQVRYVAPTPVQAAVIGPGLEGRDLVVQSRTGSGKTCAFGLPLLARIAAGSGAPKRPRGLVLLPTRELASQVAAELTRLGAVLGTKVAAVYGGVPMPAQVGELARGVDILVATPGRLLDHARRQSVDLGGCEAVVLDEADEMLSMGFWDDVTELLRLTPNRQQTMLFSATLPAVVARAAAAFLRDPVAIDLSGGDLTVANIDNRMVHVVPDLPKPRQMLYLLEHVAPPDAIVFCNTRNDTEMLAKYLTQAGLVAEPLSGSLKQRDRERVMAKIKARELRFMVATDIAARGIDIEDLSHVFNYALPEFPEVYLHRVGRTGRIGKAGVAVSLVDGRGLGTLTQLERTFGVRFHELHLPPEAEILAKRGQRIMNELVDKAQTAEVGQHRPVAEQLLASDHAAQVVAFLLKSYFQGHAEAARRPEPAPLASPAAAPGGGAERPSDGTLDPVGDETPGNGRRKRRRRGRGRGAGAAEGQPDAATRRPAAVAAPAAGGALAAPGLRPRPRPSGRPTGDRGRRPAPTARLEVIDASEALAAEPAARSAAPRRRPQPAASPPPPPPPSAVPLAPIVLPPLPPGQVLMRVNIGFGDGFKGPQSVAKKVAALAALPEGAVTEVAARRDHALLQAPSAVADLVLDRVDGAQVGKKVVAIGVEPAGEAGL